MLSTLLLTLAAAAMAAPVSGFKVVSKSFTDGGPIPKAYTCEGENKSPELSWVGAPTGTKTFAIVVHDPDAPDPKAPQKDVTHWLVYGLPAGTVSLPEGAAVPGGAKQGRNEHGENKYMGPCPPIGEHRYYFIVYALSDDPKLPDGASRSDVMDAVQKHLLAKAEIMGTYQKAGK